MTFLAAHAGGHPSGCPHRAGLIKRKREGKGENKEKKGKGGKKRKKRRKKEKKYVPRLLQCQLALKGTTTEAHFFNCGFHLETLRHDL